jgi:hypothetical protein
MAGCRPLTFKNIPRERFLAIRARIRAQAEVSILGDTGTASGNGFSASWSYDEAAQTLTIECTEKPFFAPESLVLDKIRALVTSL